MLKVVFLCVVANMVSVAAYAAIAAPWVHLANQHCKEDNKQCIDDFRNQEIERLNQFLIQNPQLQNADFLVHECTKQGISTQEGCIKMYKVNHIKINN